MTINSDELLRTIQSVRDPYTSQSLVQLGASVEIKQAGPNTLVDLEFRRPMRASRDDWSRSIHEALQSSEHALPITVQTSLNVSRRELGHDDPVPNMKQVVLVMSGKGGVGKSTIAANLALALKRMGAKVGLLDADIYGPSVPMLFNVSGPPTGNGEKILPIEKYGISLMSIGTVSQDTLDAVRKAMAAGPAWPICATVNRFQSSGTSKRLAVTDKASPAMASASSSRCW